MLPVVCAPILFAFVLLVTSCRVPPGAVSADKADGPFSADSAGGLAWEDCQPLPFGLQQDGCVLPDSVVFMIGEKLRRSADGGRTWQVVSEQGGWRIAFADAEIGYASGGTWAGGKGYVLKTDDGGRHWREVYAGAPSGLMALAVLDRDHVVAGSPWQQNRMWLTADGGQTWTTADGAGADVHALLVTGPQSLLALNLSGVLAESQDSGRTWTKLTTFEKRPHSGRLARLADGTLLVSGTNANALLASRDGGKSFQPLPAPASGETLGVTSRGTILLASPGQALYESTDRGATWRQVLTTSLNINAVASLGTDDWAFGGAFGGIGFWPVTLLYRRGPPLPAPRTGTIPLTYNLPAAGGVTLVIDRADGTRVRNLISNQLRGSGTQTEWWDGRDEWGAFVTPDTYRWRGLTHGGVHVTAAFAFNSPGQPPWDTADGRGKWGSDHANIQSLAASGGTLVFGYPYCESGTKVMAVDAASGRRLWGQKLRLTLGNHYGGSAIALAADAEFAYVALQTAEAGIGFFRLGLNDGRDVAFPAAAERKAELDRICLPRPGVSPQPLPTLPEQFSRKRWSAATAPGSLRGCAVNARSLFISSYWDNCIVVCDKQNGATVRTLPVPEPAGLACDPAGTLFAIAGRQIVRIDPDSGTCTPVVASGLCAPVGLAADSVGCLYVSEWGDTMQVRVFRADGTPVRTIGKPGGRAIAGRYDPAGMLFPWGVAPDPTGHLWVAESDFSPRRVSVWDRAGKLSREFIGPSTYGATGGAVDPARPTRAVDTGTVFELDWDQGTCRPVYSLPRLGWHRDALFGWPYPGSSWKPHGKTRFLDVGKRRFLLWEEDPMLVFEELAGEWRLRAAIGCASGYYHALVRYSPPEFDCTAFPGYDPATWGPGKWPPPRNFKDFNFIWCDENGDGLVQAGEFQRVPLAAATDRRWSGQHQTFGPDLTACLGPDKITPAGWTACGAPRYALADLKPATADNSAAFAAHAPGWDTRLKTPGGWYITSGYTQAWKNSATPKIPGLLTGFAPDGVRRWFYPSYFHTHGSLDAPSARRGLFVGDWYYGGTATVSGLGEVFHVGGNLGQHYLFTVDGLYISELFRDARSGPLIPPALRRGMSLDDTTNGTEGWASGFFQYPGSGRFYVLSCVQHATAPVLGEVRGLTSVRRLAGGDLRVDPADVAAARAFADSATGASAQSFLPVARLKAAPTVDGRLDEWDLGVGVRVGTAGEERSGRMALAIHGDRLFLAGDVRDPFPLRNHGVDPLVLFKTGTCVDLMLATDVGAPKERTRPVAGDLRLLCAVQDDKPLAVLYRQVAPGAPADEATTFSSPNQTTRFDAVKVLADAKIAFVRRQDGFSLECSVPLAALNWKPAPGSAWRGDVGVIFADDAGQKDILRRYWSNRNANLTADTAGEAALTPAEWGELRVE